MSSFRQQLETYVIQVQRVVYRKEDTNWYILKDTNGKTCKGAVGFQVKEDIMLQLEGRWGKSEFNGEQEFTFFAAIPYLPDDALALLHYACTITKGIGETREAVIWQKYGEKWIQQEELDVPGITAATRDRWKQTLAELAANKAQTQALSFLMSHGCTLNMATAAWTAWSSATLGKVRDNVYVLTELPRYGFNIVDEKVRPYFEIPDNDPRRVDAALVYAIGQLTEQGSTVIAWNDAQEKTAELVPLAVGAFDQAVQRLAERKQLLVLSGKLISLATDFEAEEAVFRRFCA
jgi:exodeoxyribonuclease V alpha subunit